MIWEEKDDIVVNAPPQGEPNMKATAEDEMYGQEEDDDDRTADDSTIKRVYILDANMIPAAFLHGTNKKGRRRGKGGYAQPVLPPRKRVKAETWTFCPTWLAADRQLLLVQTVQQHGYTPVPYKDSKCDELSTMTRLVCQQIKYKLSGYKAQDKLKKVVVSETCSTFVTFASVIDTMMAQQLRCYYCTRHMDVLYALSREMTQWSVDRIDNTRGHDVDNYRLSCLECNLRKRRRDDDKFCFTKQFVLTKIP